MIILAFDLETTGLHLEADDVIEVGTVMYSTTQKRILESSSYLVKPSRIAVSEEITNITGITPAAVERFGVDSRTALDNLLTTMSGADALLGQNIIRFDKIVLDNWCKREQMVVPDKLLIDTRTDLPRVEGTKLKYMAADHGFLNMFPHSAMSDCLTCVTLIEKHSLDEVIERSKSPSVVLLGNQNRADNDLAKRRKFAWNPDYKIWWKVIKQIDVEAEAAACPFPVSLAPPEILIEKLWFS